MVADVPKMSFLGPIGAWFADCIAAFGVIALTMLAWVAIWNRSHKKWIAFVGTLACFGGLIALYSPIRERALAIECKGSPYYQDCTHPEPNDY